MKHGALLSSFAIALAAGGFVPSVASACGGEDCSIAADALPVAQEQVIDLVICLDTSGSMDGLINSARQKLWTIVNDLAKAEPTPRLRVALLSYGNDGNSAEDGWVKVETGFTEDLDTVSQMLFGLTTNGGTELVGRVVQTSLQKLDWYPSENALQMVFVAGNESANQDEQVAVRTICKEAAERGIDVNSIYCVYGDDDSEVQPGWREFAMSGNGEFAMIDQDNGSVIIATPYDQKLIELSTQLNATYIPFGSAGAAGCSNQWAQDANAAGLNTASAASRAATKASALYSCSSWDLVDAMRNGEIDLAEVDPKDLPEDMREMSHAQRLAKINAMQAQRTKLQSQISELDQARQTMLNKELARRATSNISSFDLAIRSAIRTRAEAVGFAFAPLGAALPAAHSAVPSTAVAMAHSFEYFVQFSGAWVSNDLVASFEDTRAKNGSYHFDIHLEPGTPGAEAFIKTLPTHVRELVGSLEGAVYLNWKDKTYLLAGGC